MHDWLSAAGFPFAQSLLMPPNELRGSSNLVMATGDFRFLRGSLSNARWYIRGVSLDGSGPSGQTLQGLRRLPWRGWMAATQAVAVCSLDPARSVARNLAGSSLVLEEYSRDATRSVSPQPTGPTC